MAVYSLAELARMFCVAVLCVQHTKSQVSLPLPTLSFQTSVNQSNIQLFSIVKIDCTVPEKAPFPVSVSISRADVPNPSSAPWLTLEDLRAPNRVIFTLTAMPEKEGPLVCWYKSRKGETSGFSNPVNLTISSLPDPIMIVHPPVFSVGSNYIAQCEILQHEFTNITLSLFERHLPITPGNESFKYIGSRILAPGEWGCSISQTNSVNAVEFMCQMEVFFNGRSMRSTSKPIAAIPEELPVRFYSSTHESAKCHGKLFVRVRDEWRPVCFPTSKENDSTVAKVVCQDLGCGAALDWERTTDSSPNAVGTPKCTGKEKKIAECLMQDQRTCAKETLQMTCTANMHPPILSVLEHNPASWVYVRTEESVTITCTFESPPLTANDRLYITFTHNGKDISTTYTSTGTSVTRFLDAPVTAGEYACYAHPRSNNQQRTKNSNSIGISIYNPPPAGPVVAAVLTTVAGVAILIFICVYRTSKEQNSGPVQPADTQEPEVVPLGNPNSLHEKPINTNPHVPQV